MRPVPLIAAVAAALGSAPALAAPPTVPADLRVDVYSDTAAELFWSRSTDPDGAVSGYEIRRDGQLVETRDGLSYFTDDLTEGRAFAFTVTAVDFDGERSAPASVSVVGGDRDGSVGAGGGRPPPPANLTSSVYSSSAAEVFWDRSDQPGLSYEVSVDGGQVVTTSGTSAFLSGLGGARGRGVDVVAIDANGQRSGAANVTLGGGGSGGGSSNPPTGGGGGGGGSDVPAPSNLRADLYSGSAGEVFWDRVPGAELSYEVRLDGETVATTNGTSYFVGNRPGLSGTSVEVVAIGPGGGRSDVSSATLGSGGGGGTNPPTGGGGGADAPDAPSNLRGEVYSGSAGEVFWDRVTGTDLSYEVSLDGEVVTRTTGTSYFAGSRPGIEGTAVEVVAIGSDGTRSDASSVTLGSGGGSTSPDPDPAPGTDAPPAPANARLEVYSGTAAELFFDRAPASANVARTEIARDGVIIGETVGTSFFDDARSPGESYRYTLVAVSDSGQRSAETVVGDADAPEPESPDSEFANLLTSPATSSPLSSGNSDRFLPGIATVANAEPLEAIRETFEDLNDKRQSDTLDVLSMNGSATTYACNGGGTFTFAPRDLGSSQAFGGINDYEASGCVDEGRTLDAEITVGLNTGFIDYRYSDAVFTDPDGVVVKFDGIYEVSGLPGIDEPRQYSWTGDWEVSDGSATLEVDDFETVVVADLVDGDDSTTEVPLRRFTSSFDVIGPLTGGVELTASTPLTFAADGDEEYYTVGRLEVLAPDDSELTISADGSGVDTAVVSFDDGTSVTIPWRSEIRFAYGTLPSN